MKSKISPFLWAGLIMIAAQVIALVIAPKAKPILAEEFTSSKVSLGPAIVFFFAAVVIIALFLFIIPLNKLKLVFRALFALMFVWGVIAVVGPFSPTYAALAMAIIAGLTWIFWARIWLHDLLLLVTLAGAGSVFGFLFAPWTFMIFMLIVAVYDMLAVRYGFMVWMADKFSQSNALPAFIFPRQVKDWRLSLVGSRVGELKKIEPDGREYAILGGGDIGFPLMLTVSVFFNIGLANAVLVVGFALIGLMGAFLIQLFWLKGKPMPALPPIALACLIGFLIGLLVL